MLLVTNTYKNKKPPPKRCYEKLVSGKLLILWRGDFVKTFLLIENHSGEAEDCALMTQAKASRAKRERG